MRKVRDLKESFYRQVGSNLEALFSSIEEFFLNNKMMTFTVKKKNKW